MLTRPGCKGTGHSAQELVLMEAHVENYCFTMRNTLQEEQLVDKFEGADKDKKR